MEDKYKELEADIINLQYNMHFINNVIKDHKKSIESIEDFIEESRNSSQINTNMNSINTNPVNTNMNSINTNPVNTNPVSTNMNSNEESSLLEYISYATGTIALIYFYMIR
jgi:hypothetical protein